VRLRTGPDSWTRLDLIARSDLSATRVDHLLLSRGASQATDQQVLLATKTADKYGYIVGQVLEIELADGTRKELPVAGIVQDLSSGKRGFLNDGIGFITADTLEWLHQPASFDRLTVAVSEWPTTWPTSRRLRPRSVRAWRRVGASLSDRPLSEEQAPHGLHRGAILNVLAALACSCSS